MKYLLGSRFTLRLGSRTRAINAMESAMANKSMRNQCPVSNHNDTNNVPPVTEAISGI